MARMSNQAKRDKLVGKNDRAPPSSQQLARKREVVRASKMPEPLTTFHQFFELPRELRDDIYRLHFVSRSPKSWDDEWRWERAAILATSSDVSQESAKVLHEVDWAKLSLVVHLMTEGDTFNLDLAASQFNLVKIYQAQEAYLYFHQGEHVPDSAIGFAQTLFVHLETFSEAYMAWARTKEHTAENMVELCAHAQAVRTVCFEEPLTHWPAPGNAPREELLVRRLLDILLSIKTTKSLCIMGAGRHPITSGVAPILGIIRDVLQSKGIECEEAAHPSCSTMPRGSEVDWSAHMFHDDVAGYEFFLKR